MKKTVGQEIRYMNDKYFADTNILVYAFDNRDPVKQKIAQNLLETIGSTGNLVLSTQVLQEFFVTITRKLKPPFPISTAYELIENFACYPLVQITPTHILNAIQRHEQEKVSFWDALIIEAALFSHCTILLSEDMQDNQLIENKLRIYNPFQTKTS